MIFSYFKLSGSLPPELGNLSNLEYLYLNNNLLIGFIPTALNQLIHLENSWLFENQLCENLKPTLKAFFDSHQAIWQPQNFSATDCALSANHWPLLATLAYFEATPVSTTEVRLK
jgi:hypothetical protein